MWLSKRDKKAIASLACEEWVAFARLLPDMDGRQLRHARRRVAGRIVEDYCDDSRNVWWTGLCVRFAMRLTMQWWTFQLFTDQAIKQAGTT